MTRIPEAGDIAWVDLVPVRGTEQAGRRPVLVLTDSEFNQRDMRSVICPITQNLTLWPTKVLLPAGLRTRGAVLAGQVRAVHRYDRGFRFIEQAPGEVLEAVRAIIGELLKIRR